MSYSKYRAKAAFRCLVCDAAAIKGQPCRVCDAVKLIRFDSHAEARHYDTLRLRERLGEIAALRRQVPYAIEMNGVFICKYVADFVYLADGAEIVVDVKGMDTDVSKLKRRLVEAQYGLTIQIVWGNKHGKIIKSGRRRRDLSGPEDCGD